MMQSFVTVAIPFAATRSEQVRTYLKRLGNPAKHPISRVLDDTNIVHFMSITVVDGTAADTAHILLELSADGAADIALERISDNLSGQLQELLEAGGVSFDRSELYQFLARRRIRVGQGWLSQTPGLNFSGTPRMTVSRIKQEAALAARVSTMLDERRPDHSAFAILESVRMKLWDDDAMKWAFVAEPAPSLEAMPSALSALLPVLGSAVATLLWPFLALAALPIVVFAVAIYLWPSLPNALGGVSVALWVTALIVVVELSAGATAYVRLRQLERSDVPDDKPPIRQDVDEIMERESYSFQNHLAAVSTTKAGHLRRLTLRLGLWAAGQIAAHFSRPGFLGNTAVIHFARWILLPGTDKLLFFSNYDGAWESYLEDFIEKAHLGVTGIWSNTNGFPRTTNLFFDGAADGGRLRRWTRRQQLPTLFWYSAYPGLTLTRIRTNAAIRQGIALARTETEAADWLACFGSAPRPPDEIESAEVPTLVFGGLRHLPHGACLLLRLSDGELSKAWLCQVASFVAYGDSRDASTASVVGFSQSGLRKLGLADGQIGTFPVAFQDGMFAPWRARALGDMGNNAPEKWWWGGPESRVDAILLLYAREAAELEKVVAARRQEAMKFEAEIVRLIEFEPLRDPAREPFGFVDGISQPVLRGVGRWRTKDANQVIEPGEIILGYSDNRGYMPPSPTVSASDDPRNILPAWDPNPFRQRPDFSTPPPTGQRDLGCNGTFLVVRQLEQDVKGFEAFLDDAAEAVREDSRVPTRDKHELREWIAAKMVGRWRDGRSLVRHPDFARMATSARTSPDNAFQFGIEDADGRRCPFGAHIRRANPRDSFAPGSAQQLAITNRHRILRVGRPYRPQGDREKAGLIFMCLNADIERQFEFVQQTWVLGPSFHGLENEVDPVVARGQTKPVFSIPTSRGPLRLKGLKEFVRVRGGGYFFLPGRKAIQFLSQTNKAAPDPWVVRTMASQDRKPSESLSVERVEPKSQTVAGK